VICYNAFFILPFCHLFKRIEILLWFLKKEVANDQDKKTYPHFADFPFLLSKSFGGFGALNLGLAFHSM